MTVLRNDLTGFEQPFLELVYQSSEPYNDFAYDSRELAVRVQRYLFERNACEFAPPYAWLAEDAGKLLGMIVALPAEELQRCRLRAALAMAKSSVAAEHPAASRRLQLASHTLLKAQPGDFYISQVAVHPDARNRGIGKLLLDHAEREARARGCARLVLEVCPRSEAAVRLYRREGYEQLDSRRVVDPESGRSLEFLHLAKVIAPE
jgi:ribosomal protein S18 acetylase RimI-like enzyme